MKRITNNEEEIYYPNRYSTTEKKIGTWIDGKPIYRRVINFATTPDALSSSTLTVGTAIPSGISFATIDQFIKAFFYRKPQGTQSTQTSAIEPIYLRKNSNTQLNYTSATAVSNRTGLIIEYTKNTD